MVTRRPARGYTLIEIMVTLVIIGVLFGIIPGMVVQVVRFFSINSVRLELQRDAREITELSLGRLRQAVASTVVIDRAPNQPPYSRVQFRTTTGSLVTFWQSGRKFFATDSVNSPQPRAFTQNLRYLAFTYVGTMDDGVMSVNLCLEKTSFRQKRVYHVANERVRILNE